jgi:hypothetical protein
MGVAAIFQTGLRFLPLAGGLTIPFLGGQKTDKQPLNLFPDNTGINFDFQKLLNLGKRDTFTEDFLQGKTTDKYPMSSEAVQGLKDQATLFNKDGDYVGGVLPSGIVESNPFDFQKLLDLGKKDTFTTDKYPMSSEAVQGLKDQATLFNKDGDYVGGVLPSGIVESRPNTTFSQEQNQILGADGRPIVESNTSSTTFSDISSNNNNNNNNKDGNKYNKLLYGSLLAGTLFEGGKYLFNKAKDIFGKTDDNDGKGKSDFEDITGITYEKAMELQRKRENELMNRRALEGGIKDAGKYMYLAGQAGMEAGKNIGRNTQDMLRSMAYGQSSLANTIAAAAKTTPLTRTYFS